MSDTTVGELAADVGIPVEGILRQLGEAGISKQSGEDVVTEQEKRVLLDHLRRSHGKKPPLSRPSIQLSSVKFSRRALAFIGDANSATASCLAAKLISPATISQLPHIAFPPPWRNLYCIEACNHYAILSVRNGDQGRISDIVPTLPGEFSGWLR